MRVARTLKRTLAGDSLAAGRCGGGAGHGRSLLQKSEPRFALALTLAVGGRYSKEQVFRNAGVVVNAALENASQGDMITLT
jgi:hypothetical protein